MNVDEMYKAIEKTVAANYPREKKPLETRIVTVTSRPEKQACAIQSSWNPTYFAVRLSSRPNSKQAV